MTLNMTTNVHLVEIMKNSMIKQKSSKIERIDIWEFDERFYTKIVDNKVVYRPSVTHKIGMSSPAEYGFTRWRGDVGNRRADEILEETSRLGTFVHDGIYKILMGEKIVSDKIRTEFKAKDSLKVLKCFKGFMEWYEEYKPKILSTEYITWNDEHNFAGTVDCKCEIDGKVYLIDWKTSKSIHTSHKVQLSAYGYSEKVENLALLQLGNTTKKGWSFLEMKDREKHFNYFLAYSNTFEVMYPDAKPKTDVFPEYFKLNKKK